MRVVCEGAKSTEAPDDSGVPQGTVLGPLLFFCHINDLPESVTSQVRLFADDCLLYRPIQSKQDQDILQKDLVELEKWANKWGMRFNAKKCYVMHMHPRKSAANTYIYNLCGHALETVQDNPYLGVQISNDLKWKKHISNTVNKASVALGILRRNLRFLPKDCKNTAYKSIVRSVLEYGCIVWDPYIKSDSQALEKVQRRAARFIIQDYKSKSSGFMTQTLKDLYLPSLEQRRLYNRLVFFYKTANGHVPAVNIQHYTTQIESKRCIRPKRYSGYLYKNPIDSHARVNSKSYEVKTSNTAQYKNSFFIRTANDWNTLENPVVCDGTLDKIYNNVHLISSDIVVILIGTFKT